MRTANVAGSFQVTDLDGRAYIGNFVLLKLGVIARAMPQGDILGFAPPLCLTRAEADIIVGKTKQAVDEAFAAK